MKLLEAGIGISVHLKYTSIGAGKGMYFIYFLDIKKRSPGPSQFSEQECEFLFRLDVYKTRFEVLCASMF